MIIRSLPCLYAFLVAIAPFYSVNAQTTPDDENMILVEGGTFQMGSEDGSSIEQPVHTVTVSDFYISRYELTVAEYMEFVKATRTHYPEWLEPKGRYNINTGYDDAYSRMGEALTTPTHPIVGVSWHDAVAYCTWLSEKEGLNYRLPTEAEWEYAARGGNASEGYRYAGSDDIDEVAWIEENTGKWFHPVGQKKANELGLFDMSGNVWEWCHDVFEAYSAEDQTNPQGPENGQIIIFRGGGHSVSEDRCTPSTRNDNSKIARLQGIGFRVARSR